MSRIADTFRRLLGEEWGFVGKVWVGLGMAIAVAGGGLVYQQVTSADATAPSVPASISTASVTQTTLTVNWGAATDNVGVTNYRLYRNAGLINSANVLTFNDTGRTCNTTYTYAVEAQDAAGNTGPQASTPVTMAACSGDTTPPTVALTAPANGATVSGSTTVSATASDNVGVTLVEFFRAGSTLIAQDSISPYSVSWDTTAVANGSQTLTARASDAAGNQTTSASRSVTVSNGGSSTCPLPAYPDASCTGVPAGTTLTNYTGPNPVTVAGTVIDGKIMGCMDINAANVTIRNSRISCNDGFAILINGGNPGVASLLIEDSELDCQDQGGTAIAFSDVTARRLDIDRCENGFSIDQDALIEDSYIHDLTQNANAHPDGVQCDCSNVTARHNTIYGTSEVDGLQGNASWISGRVAGGPNANILLEYNLFAGGGYTLYCYQQGPGTNYRVLNNHFSTRFQPNVGFYGPSTDCSDETQSGNVIHETGAPLFLD